MQEPPPGHRETTCQVQMTGRGLTLPPWTTVGRHEPEA